MAFGVVFKSRGQWHRVHACAKINTPRLCGDFTGTNGTNGTKATAKTDRSPNVFISGYPFLFSSSSFPFFSFFFFSFFESSFIHLKKWFLIYLLFISLIPLHFSNLIGSKERTQSQPANHSLNWMNGAGRTNCWLLSIARSLEKNFEWELRSIADRGFGRTIRPPKYRRGSARMSSILGAEHGRDCIIQYRMNQ